MEVLPPSGVLGCFLRDAGGGGGLSGGPVATAPQTLLVTQKWWGTNDPPSIQRIYSHLYLKREILKLGTLRPAADASIIDQ